MAHIAKTVKTKGLIDSSGKPRHKSRSLKRVQKRLPGGRTVVKYKHKKTSKHKCAVCKNLLHGVPRGTSSQIKKLKKSERKPERPFSGQLCPPCTRKILVLKAKVKYEKLTEKEVPISLKSYVF
jgi:large subunit ribosomal protein L34e